METTCPFSGDESEATVKWVMRAEAALIEIRDGYGPNHGSKFCRDQAAAALNSETEAAQSAE